MSFGCHRFREWRMETKLAPYDGSKETFTGYWRAAGFGTLLNGGSLHHGGPAAPAARRLAQLALLPLIPLAVLIYGEAPILNIGKQRIFFTPSQRHFCTDVLA
jgi:hypothetical protein